LLLFAIPSSLFDTALSALCDVFLTERMPVVFTLVLYHSSPELGRAALRDAVRERMDLIFSMGSATTAFVHASFRNGPVPVVTIMSKDPVLLGQMPNYRAGSGTNIAYTSVNVPVQVQMAYLRRLEPGLRAIGVLYGLDDPSARQTQVAPLKLAAASRHIKVIDITVRGVQTAQRDLLSAMPRAISALRQVDPSLRHCVLWVTGSTAIVNEMHTVQQLSGHIPVLSVFPELVQQGEDSAVLSIGVSFQAASQLASLYGIDILRGQVRPGSLKVGTVSPPDIAINFQKAREDGLKIPFSFFESAGFIYNDAGRLVRSNGENVQ
jgi:putative ABC transport system substrate-binding protein